MFSIFRRDSDANDAETDGHLYVYVFSDIHLSFTSNLYASSFPQHTISI